MSVEVIVGDCREVLNGMEPESIDAVVCDPPYELAFMSKGWDSAGVSFDSATWRACFRVLKPGGHLLAFGGTRTVHRIAVAIEDSGFEIRDQIVWLYGSGFPKSHNIGDGYGTALKPAHEPVVVARKPLIGTVAANVTEYGTGALNIDGCRIAGEPWKAHDATGLASVKFFTSGNAPVIHKEPHTGGRWPANVALDEDAAAMLDAQTGERPGMKRRVLRRGATTGNSLGNGVIYSSGRDLHVDLVGYSDNGGASRFFYVAKASRAERNAGLDGMPERVKPVLCDTGYDGPKRFDGTDHPVVANHHPTVKPIALMRWLVRLVTPPGGVVCDPFLGSGSTGCAAVLEGFRFIGIEQDAEYAEIARRRIAHAQGTLFAEGAA